MLDHWENNKKWKKVLEVFHHCIIWFYNPSGYMWLTFRFKQLENNLTFPQSLICFSSSPFPKYWVLQRVIYLEMIAYLPALKGLCHFWTLREKLLYNKIFNFSILFIHIGKRKEEMLSSLFPGNIKNSLPYPAVHFVLFYFVNSLYSDCCLVKNKRGFFSHGNAEMFISTLGV